MQLQRKGYRVTKMKKILCVLLALCCAFALLSCTPSSGVLDVYAAAVADKTPTNITTRVDYTKEGEALYGYYVQRIEGENSIFDYEYTRFATIEEGAGQDDGQPADPVKTVKGTIYYRDGQYSYNGGAWESEAPTALRLDYKKFALKAENLTNPVLTDNGNKLTAVLRGEQISAVVGTELGAAGDVELTVTSDGNALREISLRYETESGATVSVRTTYSYNALQLDFDKR